MYRLFDYFLALPIMHIYKVHEFKSKARRKSVACASGELVKQSIEINLRGCTEPMGLEQRLDY